jgi:dipeptidyl aminopeptidase/acylaminoacyl peptidase
MTVPMDASDTPFTDLGDYLALPRVSGLTLSPDGERLVVSMAALDEKAAGYVSSLWEVDPTGAAPAARLTWGARSESAPAFTPDGSVLFLSARPDPEHPGDDDPPTSLWLLPARGEARPLAARPGGIAAVAVARDAGTVVLASATLPGSRSASDDAERHKARKDAKVSAVLHDSYPVRYWDAEIGPATNRLYLATPGEEPRDLTGPVGVALEGESSWTLSPDGRTVAAGWEQLEPAGSARRVLVALDVEDGTRRVLLDDPAFEYGDPAFSPDGTKLAFVAERRSDLPAPVDLRLCVLHLSGPHAGTVHDAAPDWDRWPASRPVWTPDGGALLVTADDAGRGPVWRIDLDTRSAVRLTTDDAAYTDLALSRDGTALYALRATIGAPPAPVRLDLAAAGAEPVALRGPAPAVALPGHVVDLSTTADDGTPVRGWLALPAGASAQRPAPLLVMVHGGPLGSWNAWSWRWNPWLAVARGYAVLLPDPALSTGYGLAAIERGWGRWGQESYTDVMAITDAAVARDEVDAERTALAGGSYGGYMANWVAGHTDRFRAIVSHAGLWALDQFGPTTDAAYYWRREMTPQLALENSPHRFVDRIRTPMLVIHGDRDYRVPIGEALRLWAELIEHQPAKDDGEPLPHRLLIFPDENHWILKPQNTRVWYETIFAFLDHTVHGAPWTVPDLLH